MLSVILPYRDSAATIGDAITSTIDGAACPLELVAIDDGSTDDGPSIVHQLAQRDPRIRPVSTPGLGIARALSLGTSLARFDLVARMDGDDISLPGRLDAQVDALSRNPDIAAVGTLVEGFPDHVLEGGMRRYIAWQNALVSPDDHARDIFVESVLCHPSVMMRRSALDLAGGYREGNFPEDYDLWLRMLDLGLRIAKVPRLLLRWRHHPRRATLRDGRMALPRLVETKAPFLARAIARLGRPFVIWGAGKTGKHLARALEPHGARPLAFLDIDPRKIGRTARGAPIQSLSALRLGGPLVVVAVGEPGARAQVRAHLVALRFVEGHDFVCAA